MTDKKYVIYQNDLKFRNQRLLDESKIDWNQNNIKHLYGVDHDSLEYRIKDSDNNKNIEIDLREMKLNNIPNEIKSNKFINLSHLFLSNNNLTGYLDFSMFKNLITLDLDSNDITKIKLPENLSELSINNNKLEYIECNKKLLRLKASNNNIANISIETNIEILELDNNKIEKLNIDKLNKLERLIIFCNPIKNIKLSSNLTYLDISETNIDNIDYISSDRLIHLVANSCINLKILPRLKELKILEIINTPIDKLFFYENFELIILQFNLTKNISTKYKENGANIQIRKNTLLVISRSHINI